MRSKMMKNTQAVLFPNSKAANFSGLHAQKGFTAVEVAMVATVIAIIALLALPIFRDRAEAAREAAVFDELSSMAKMMLLVEADIGLQPRLQDLDNVEIRGGDPITMMPWNGTGQHTDSVNNFIGARQNITNNWGGPYLAFTSRSSAPIDNDEILTYWYLADDNGYIVVKNNAPATDSNANTFNPIRGTLAGEAEDDYGIDLYPLDPWGNPYAFFGKGRLNDSESIFNSSLIVSFGPDGVAGNAGPIQLDPTAYRRFDGSGSGQIGNPIFDTDDVDQDGDFVYRF